MKLYRLALLLIATIFATHKSVAHPMPHSVLILNMHAQQVTAVIKIPLKELQYAVYFDVSSQAGNFIQQHEQEISAYLLSHIHPTATSGQPWTVEISNMWLDTAEQDGTGKYRELGVDMIWRPPATSATRHFILNCDVIMHELVTHKILVATGSDFAGGKINRQQTQVGILYVNPASNSIAPLAINLEEGGAWRGFCEMIKLGISHIANGTDHLLFLLVLLLPAALLAENGRWTHYGGGRYSLLRLVKLATAFTVGHSVSLLLGTIQWLVLPQQPVEIAIAITILVTAIHAMLPLFYGKEIYIATGFGLIHGLAFASVLTELNLQGKEMATAILGFNIGIELMQLFVILCTVPWLMVLSRYNTYHWLRIAGAMFAIIASLAWIAERISNTPNVVSAPVGCILQQGKWLVLFVACFAVIVKVRKEKTNT